MLYLSQDYCNDLLINNNIMELFYYFISVALNEELRLYTASDLYFNQYKMHFYFGNAF